MINDTKKPLTVAEARAAHVADLHAWRRSPNTVELPPGIDALIAAAKREAFEEAARGEESIARRLDEIGDARDRASLGSVDQREDAACVRECAARIRALAAKVGS